MNTPSVFFWKHEQIPMREEAQTYFDALEHAGILYDGPKNAAEHINRIASDIQGWWNNADVQAARKMFCDNFASADADWKEQWSEKLKYIN